MLGIVEAVGGALRHYFAIRNRGRGQAHVRDGIFHHALELDATLPRPGRRRRADEPCIRRRGAGRARARRARPHDRLRPDDLRRLHRAAGARPGARARRARPAAVHRVRVLALLVPLRRDDAIPAGGARVGDDARGGDGLGRPRRQGPRRRAGAVGPVPPAERPRRRPRARRRERGRRVPAVPRAAAAARDPGRPLARLASARSTGRSRSGRSSRSRATC